MDMTLRMQITIQATPEKVFKALSESEAVKTWFAEYTDISPEQKRYDFWGRFTPDAPSRDEGHHPLLEYEDTRRLKFRWWLCGQDTTVEFHILKRDNRTIVTVLHENAVGGSHTAKAYTIEDFWFLSLENLRRYLDGRSCEARVDFSQPMTGNIEHSIEIDASPQRVFEVLIRPEELERWIASKARVEPKVGGDFDLGWAGVPAFKILELKPGEKLAYSGPEGDADGNIIETIVTWTLEESGGKTRLTIVHSGFAPDQPTGGYKAGWRNFLNWVRSVAEYGPDWQPPLLPLAEPMLPYYPASIGRAQGELVL